jgi:uncharacterized protein YjbJ (UPF0337 family)
MNKDKLKGTIKDIAGKAQQVVGKAIDNKEMQIKGLHKQGEGKAEKIIGDAKQGIKEVNEAIKQAANKR